MSLDAIFNCDANRVQLFWRLAREKPGGANACIAFCMKKWDAFGRDHSTVRVS